MKEQSKIPTSKVKRASKMMGAGMKVGGNYIKYYAKKITGDENAKSQLDEDNANDIYNTLSEMKGSALKAAQIISMDRSFLPQAYQDKFAKAQYSVPPLSYPLVVKTFLQHFQKKPTEVFETFSKSALNAASIGQVHQATLGEQKLAVKVQYPGVGDSVKSDLNMIRPLAKTMFGLKDKDIEPYFAEVEERLLEETDYEIELKNSVFLTDACKEISNLYFPIYFPEYSTKKILTMSWIEGIPLSEFVKTNPSQEIRNKAGQAIWDFYTLQMHKIKSLHADPHPGNFLIKEDGTVGVIDFGCIKHMPDDFHKDYMTILDHEVVKSGEKLEKLFYKLDILYPNDSAREKEVYFDIFKKLVTHLSLPFRGEEFDFGNDKFFDYIYEFGDEISKDKEIRKMNNARGSKHMLYVNRTNFGLYSILNQLKAKIKVWNVDIS